MISPLIDTNVILRYLIEEPNSIDKKFKGVLSFFAKLEMGEEKAFLPDIVLFQAYFVLTSFYKVPQNLAAEKLSKLLSLKGLISSNKKIMQNCLSILIQNKIDIVDAYIIAFSKENKLTGVYSFDTDLKKGGLTLLAVD